MAIRLKEMIDAKSIQKENKKEQEMQSLIMKVKSLVKDVQSLTSRASDVIDTLTYMREQGIYVPKGESIDDFVVKITERNNNEDQKSTGVYFYGWSGVFCIRSGRRYNHVIFIRNGWSTDYSYGGRSWEYVLDDSFVTKCLNEPYTEEYEKVIVLKNACVYMSELLANFDDIESDAMEFINSKIK